ncbi:hypothetical protein [Clostridium sp. KNHs205]|jgi:hypothetical protein|uniref:hypothetical protein n=1 Tax=Clostridium sp. KNHs205 TaxID=1449050 RepID=UPI00051CA796|nr:hypothetical protein [Clostridium sp. KNHs205]
MDNIVQPAAPEEELIPCEKTCPTSAFQLATVCVPITVVPYAKAGIPTTTCYGEPYVSPGKKECCGRPNGTCSFTLSQKILVEVPVVFGAKAVVGNTSVDCDCVSAKDLIIKDNYTEEETELA